MNFGGYNSAHNRWLPPSALHSLGFWKDLLKSSFLYVSLQALDCFPFMEPTSLVYVSGCSTILYPLLPPNSHTCSLESLPRPWVTL